RRVPPRGPRLGRPAHCGCGGVGGRPRAQDRQGSDEGRRGRGRASLGRLTDNAPKTTKPGGRAARFRSWAVLGVDQAGGASSVSSASIVGGAGTAGGGAAGAAGVVGGAEVEVPPKLGIAGFTIWYSCQAPQTMRTA